MVVVEAGRRSKVCSSVRFLFDHCSLELTAFKLWFEHAICVSGVVFSHIDVFKSRESIVQVPLENRILAFFPPRRMEMESDIVLSFAEGGRRRGGVRK